MDREQRRLRRHGLAVNPVGARLLLSRYASSLVLPCRQQPRCTHQRDGASLGCESAPVLHRQRRRRRRAGRDQENEVIHLRRSANRGVAKRNALARAQLSGLHLLGNQHLYCSGLAIGRVSCSALADWEVHPEVAHDHCDQQPARLRN